MRCQQKRILQQYNRIYDYNWAATTSFSFASLPQGKKFNPYISRLTSKTNTLLALKDITDALGAKKRWDVKSKSTIVEYSGKTVQLKAGANYYLLNGVKQWISANEATALFISKKRMYPFDFLS